jgi:acyl transferase domain-containing protein
VGVFVGLCNNEWKYSNGTGELGPYHTTGSAQSAAANRLSFLLGLTGPSMVVDTACSSSLAALHTAMNALRCGDCDVALVAAADLLVSDYSIQVMCKYTFVFSLVFFIFILLLVGLVH